MKSDLLSLCHIDIFLDISDRYMEKTESVSTRPQQCLPSQRPLLDAIHLLAKNFTLYTKGLHALHRCTSEKLNEEGMREETAGTASEFNMEEFRV